MRRSNTAILTSFALCRPQLAVAHLPDEPLAGICRVFSIALALTRVSGWGATTSW